jgi:hypothetical protein
MPHVAPFSRIRGGRVPRRREERTRDLRRLGPTVSYASNALKYVFPLEAQGSPGPAELLRPLRALFLRTTAAACTNFRRYEEERGEVRAGEGFLSP